jgi:hypothetical protein
MQTSGAGEVPMRQLATETQATVRSGKLIEPFDGAMLKVACPGWAERTYFTSLAKYAVGNSYTTELFVRVGRG